MNTQTQAHQTRQLQRVAIITNKEKTRTKDRGRNRQGGKYAKGRREVTGATGEQEAVMAVVLLSVAC